MKGLPEERAVALGEHITATGATVRETAQKFGVSKSTVHKDVTERLTRLDSELAARVKAVLELNKSERHIRGGMATKNKYAACRKKRAVASGRY